MVFASFPKIQDVDMIISNRHHICQYIVPENLYKILMPKPQADLCIVTKGQEDLSVCGLVKEGGGGQCEQESGQGKRQMGKVCTQQEKQQAVDQINFIADAAEKGEQGVIPMQRPNDGAVVYASEKTQGEGRAGSVPIIAPADPSAQRDPQKGGGTDGRGDPKGAAEKFGTQPKQQIECRQKEDVPAVADDGIAVAQSVQQIG